MTNPNSQRKCILADSTPNLSLLEIDQENKCGEREGKDTQRGTENTYRQRNEK